METLNLKVLYQLATGVKETKSYEDLFKEFRIVWVFDNHENYGMGCTGCCTDCLKFDAIDDLHF